MEREQGKKKEKRTSLTVVKAHWSVIGVAVKGLFREGEGVSKRADGEEVGAHLHPNLRTAIRYQKMTEGFLWR